MDMLLLIKLCVLVVGIKVWVNTISELFYVDFKILKYLKIKMTLNKTSSMSRINQAAGDGQMCLRNKALKTIERFHTFSYSKQIKIITLPTASKIFYSFPLDLQKEFLYDLASSNFDAYYAFQDKYWDDRSTLVEDNLTHIDLYPKINEETDEPIEYEYDKKVIHQNSVARYQALIRNIQKESLILTDMATKIPTRPKKNLTRGQPKKLLLDNLCSNLRAIEVALLIHKKNLLKLEKVEKLDKLDELDTDINFSKFPVFVMNTK
jgi:hypothetical protein